MKCRDKVIMKLLRWFFSVPLLFSFQYWSVLLHAQLCLLGAPAISFSYMSARDIHHT